MKLIFITLLLLSPTAYSSIGFFLGLAVGSGSSSDRNTTKTIVKKEFIGQALPCFIKVTGISNSEQTINPSYISKLEIIKHEECINVKKEKKCAIINLDQTCFFHEDKITETCTKTGNVNYTLLHFVNENNLLIKESEFLLKKKIKKSCFN